MKASVRVAHSEAPSKAAAAVAALCGVVIGALGGGFLDAAVLGVLILIAFGVWRGVSYLSVITTALTAAGDRNAGGRLPTVAEAAAGIQCDETVRFR